MGELVRSFIAVEIENREVYNKILRVRDMLAEAAGSAVKPVEDENIHITIRFLGEIDTGTLAEVKRVLGEMSIKRFVIHVRGLGGFPDISRPRVVWVGVAEGGEELRGIRRYIDEKTRGLRIHVDQHEFHPHITIARVKTSLPARASQLLFSYRDEDFGYSEVSRIVLKKSTLTPRGPIYTDLFSRELL